MSAPGRSRASTGARSTNVRLMTPTVRRAPQMPPGSPDVAVAIVGAGACGLTAALMLRDAGIDCVLLERDAVT